MGISGHGLKDPKLHAHSIASIKYNLGRVLLDMERIHEAIEVFVDVVHTRPPHFEPHSTFNMLGENVVMGWGGVEKELEMFLRKPLGRENGQPHFISHRALALRQSEKTND